MGTAFAWSPDVVSLLTHWALPFLVVLGVLVAFHEMGHFLWACRWRPWRALSGRPLAFRSGRSGKTAGGPRRWAWRRGECSLPAFVIAAFFAGIAGTLFAVSQGAAFPDYAGLRFTLDALIMVVIGGLHSFWSGVIGAVIFTQLRHWAPLVTDHWELGLGVILLIIVIALPHGVASVTGKLTRMLGLEKRQ